MMSMDWGSSSIIWAWLKHELSEFLLWNLVEGVAEHYIAQAFQTLCKFLHAFRISHSWQPRQIGGHHTWPNVHHIEEIYVGRWVIFLQVLAKFDRGRNSFFWRSVIVQFLLMIIYPQLIRHVGMSNSGKHEDLHVHFQVTNNKWKVRWYPVKKKNNEWINASEYRVLAMLT